MLIEEEDKEAVKQWLQPKLESISDVAPDVLAEYVVALVSVDGPVDSVKQSATQALSEFLPERAASFIDQVILGIQQRKWVTAAATGSYSHAAHKESHAPSIVSFDQRRRYGQDVQALERAPQSTSSLRNPPTGPAAQRWHPNTSAGYPQDNRGGPSRKRRLDEEHGQGYQSPSSSFNIGDQPTKKHAARREGRFQFNHPGASERNSLQYGTSVLPTPNFGFTPAKQGPGSFAPAHNFSDPITFVTAVAQLFGLGYPTVPPATTGSGDVSQSALSMRCRSYDTQGFCILGTACPFDHTNTESPEYDPTRPSLAFDQSSSDSRNNNRQSRGRLSRTGNTKLAVKTRYNQGREQDGDDFHNEGWSTAHNQPAKIGNVSTDTSVPEIYMEQEDLFDYEAFEKQQAKAQKVFEERRAKLQEKNVEAEEIERKLRAREQEISHLRQKLAEKVKAKGEEEIDKREKEHNSSAIEVTNGLSSLHAEAEGLFAQHESSAQFSNGMSRGDGVARGRGGRGNRGTLRCAVKRMDNRPKRLAIAGVEPDSEKDYAVRSYLQLVEGCDDVQLHAGRPDTLVVSFSERYLAEKFLDEAVYIPGVGPLRLSWVPNGEPVVTESREREVAPVEIEAEAEHDSSVANERPDNEALIKVEDELDLDVAEDAYQWG